MQNIKGKLRLQGGAGAWTDGLDQGAETPRLTLALAARLLIDLRAAVQRSDESAELAPYPYAELAACASWYIAIDSDYDPLTMPPVKRFSGISVYQGDNGETMVSIELPELDSPALRSAVKKLKELPLKGELGGLNAEGRTAFVLEFPIVLKNRVYIPDGSGGETPDPSDPEYSTTAQVKAYISEQLETAMGALELPEGLPGAQGPPPTLREVGLTLTQGGDPSASFDLVSEGVYDLLLSIPAPQDGQTPAPIAPQISIGLIQAGPQAAASLSPAPGQPGAYILDLTLPRGADGSGVYPAGQWSAETVYSLNAAVRHNHAWWRSLTDDNLGNEPPASRQDTAYWEVIVKDGLSADPLIVNFNSTDDPADLHWHLYLQSSDRFYRFSIDG
ncbi:MAG: hypothetical protein WCS95_09915, partial [Lentisphaeria bacterium]